MSLLDQVIKYMTKHLGRSPSFDEISKEINGAGLLFMLDQIKKEEINEAINKTRLHVAHNRVSTKTIE